MFRALKYLILGFFSGFTLFFCVFVISHPPGQALVMAAVVGLIYSLFCLGFMARLMKTDILRVTPANKDPQKGMAWYAEEIRQQIYDLRFKKVGESTSFEVYHPTGLRRVYEGRVELSVGVYEVRVKASRMVIRILSDLVEIAAETKK